MDSPPPYELQFLIVSGTENPARAVLGFNMALAAAISRVRVAVVLTMHGAEWAAPSVGNEVIIAGFPTVAELMRLFLEEGGEIHGCSSCIEQFCPAPTSANGDKMIRSGITKVGLQVITLRLLETRTVTF